MNRIVYGLKKWSKFTSCIVRENIRHFALRVFLDTLLLSMLYLLFAHDRNRIKDQPISLGIDNSSLVTIMVRAYEGSILELQAVLSVSLELFKPVDFTYQYLIILDDENPRDHQVAPVLEALPPYPKVLFEPYHKDTYCVGGKREGFSRQQHSNFLGDLYTDSKYIGFMDSDTFFVAPIKYKDLFVNGKPRLYGYNGCCSRKFCEATVFLGLPCYGEFMVSIGFPVFIKREHLKEIREYIMKKTNTTTFDQAFHFICTKYDYTGYSQFNIMGNYLFHFHRNEYSFHMKYSKGHPSLTKHNKSQELLDYNVPIKGLAKHFGHSNYGDLFSVIADYYCYSYNSSHCNYFMNDKIKKNVEKNFYVDFPYETSDWKKRNMPKGYRSFNKGELGWLDNQLILSSNKY